MKHSKVFVNRADSFLGAYCIRELLHQGFDVRGTLENRKNETPLRHFAEKHKSARTSLELWHKGVEWLEGGNDHLEACQYLLYLNAPPSESDSEGSNEKIALSRRKILEMLKAARKMGIKRVVMESSLHTTGLRPGKLQQEGLLEEHWIDLDTPGHSFSAIQESLKEKAAWNFVSHQSAGIELVVIIPGFPFGPSFDHKIKHSSFTLMKRLLRKRHFELPCRGWPIVDVRDLARLFVLALTNPDAAGKRFLGVNKFVWLFQIDQLLEGQHGLPKKAPLRIYLPAWVLRPLCVLDSSYQILLEGYSNEIKVKGKQAKNLLGWTCRPVEETLFDTALSLIPLEKEEEKRGT